MKRISAFLIHVFIMVISVSGGLGASGVKEWVQPASTRDVITALAGDWTFESAEAEYRLTSGADQLIYAPYGSRWQGLVEISGAVKTVFAPYVTEGLGAAGMGAVIVSNSPLYSGEYPVFTLSLYDAKIGGNSSLDVIFSKDSYKVFAGPVSFVFTGTNLDIPKTRLSGARPDEYIWVEANASAPLVSLPAGTEITLPVPYTLFPEPAAPENIRFGYDGSISGSMNVEGAAAEFTGIFEIVYDTLKLTILTPTGIPAASYTYRFDSKNELRLYKERPAPEKGAIETMFGFIPGTLKTVSLRETRTYMRGNM